jgi:hypothetical protein
MIPMRRPLSAAALCGGLFGSCVAAGPAAAPEAYPSPNQEVAASVEIARGGAPFAAAERTLWRSRANRIELEGGERGLEISLRPEFNLAGEFWGELTVAEYDVLEDGTRVHYLGMPQVFELRPTVVRRWTVAMPGRGCDYAITVELDFGFALKSELLLRD